MKRQIATLSGCLCIFFLYQGNALAQSPHFIFCSASIGTGHQADDLIVSWKEAGLGNNELITYTASADATAQYGCINGGGNHPKAGNKETVSGPVSATGTFNSGKNGSISQSLTVPPPGPGSFSCPSGQTLVLLCGSYTNAEVTDDTNNIPCDAGAGPFTFSDPQFGEFCTLTF